MVSAASARSRAIFHDGAGDVFVADSSPRIQKFTSDGIFITSWGSAGTGNGQFDFPRGLSTDGAGNVYVADRNNHRMQKFTGNGAFITKWGSFGTGDGQFALPYGVRAGGDVFVYVTDSSNNRVQKFCFSSGTASCEDCNENGDSDGFDIGTGSSSDFDANGVPDECDPLSADTDQISLSVGGTQTLTLDAGPGIGVKIHVLLGTASGTSPGQTDGALVLPLNFDPYFLFTLLNPNTLIANSLGFLNGLGMGTASLTLPAGLDPALAGTTLHHAYVVVDLGVFTTVFVSNSVPLALTP